MNSARQTDLLGLIHVLAEVGIPSFSPESLPRALSQFSANRLRAPASKTLPQEAQVPVQTFDWSDPGAQ
jgi:hypothetical protein